MENNTAQKKYIKLLFPALLILTGFYLSFKNYSPETYLTGWDTLHPEFNFSLYWERILGGAWQDHQGLGTVASQAHASEIPRVFILQFLDLFLAQSQLRYAYAFLMLILGPLGVYFFLLELFKKNDSIPKFIAAFIGASFYLLNLSTLQHFYVPLEMFLTHFAFLGWLFYFVIRFLGGDRRSLVWLALVSFFSASQAHTATLFFALVFTLTVFLFLYVLQKGGRTRIKRSAAVLGVILLTNVFWLGPNLYFVITNAKEISESKIHGLFSQEASTQSQEYGSIDNVSVLKGFLFNWGEHVGSGDYGDLLDEWKVHYAGTSAEYTGFLFFGLSILGIILFGVRREKYFLAAFGLFIVSFFFVANNNPPLGFLYSALQEGLPLFREAFRFPFTKFSTLLAFSYAIFGGYAILWILSKIDTFESGKLLVKLLGFGLFMSLVSYMYPAFRGNLISSSMRVAIPGRYFKLFDYFDIQGDYGRVAHLPIHSFWGWVNYNWEPDTKMGYQGAGFLWFGIKQPLLDREFDRWGAANEQYYREMSYAVYSQSWELFENILTKYDVRWIVLDESIIQPGMSDKVLFLDEIEGLLESSELVSLDRDFGDGLYVYKVDRNYENLSRKSQVPLVGDRFLKESFDPVYPSVGDYVVTETSEYPFVGITTLDESLSLEVVSSDSTFTYLQVPQKALSTETLVSEVIIKTSGGKSTVILRDIVSGSIIAETTSALPKVFVIDIDRFLKYVDLNAGFTEKILGTISIYPDTPIKLPIYEVTKPSQRFSSSFSVLESCSVVGGQTAYTLETSELGFNLSARNVKACVTTPLSTAFIFPKAGNFLLKTSVAAEEKGAFGDICLLDEVTGKCVGHYDRVQDELLLFSQLDVSNKDHYYLRFFADSRDETETAVFYSDLNFEILTQIGAVTFDPSEIPPVINSLQKTLGFRKSVVLDPEQLSLFSSPYTCSSGSRDLRNAEVSYTASGVGYTSEGDFLCDSFKLTSVTSMQGYILEISSRNVTGLPLRVCLSNDFSTRCDLYVSLPKTSEFSTSYYLIPPMGEGGYTLNVSNLAFGTDNVSSNEISYVGFTPISYEFIKNLKVDTDTEKQDVLVLSEAFNSGWKLICGNALCDAEHVLVNNWSNGWIFWENEIPEDLTLIFWPQILQFLGHFVLFGTLVLLVLKAKTPKSPRGL